MITIIHHNDNDGFCAAAVALRSLDCDIDVELIQTDYDEPLPMLHLNFGDQVYILDFSLKPSEMKGIEEKIGRQNIIWIDHHESGIRKNIDYMNIPGKREEGTSGCMLTWQHFHGDATPPYVVELINDYDLYTLKLDPDTLNFYVYSLNINMADIEGDFWDHLLFYQKQQLCDIIKPYERIRISKTDSICRLIMNNVKIFKDDGIRYAAVNMSDSEMTSQAGSLILDEFNVDVAWMFHIKFTKKNKSVIVNQLRSRNVNVAKIAEKNGGGGHPEAAGWNDEIDNILMRNLK